MSKNKRNIEYMENSTTLVGQKRRELMDTETGEVMQVDQITKMVYGSKNFWKCYLMDFLSVLGILDSKQVDVFIYIVENTSPSNNLFIGTYDEIAGAVGCCRQTIARIMVKLQQHNFIKKKQQGVWIINPDILMKGNDNKRQILLSYYESDKPFNSVTMSRTGRKPIPLKKDVKTTVTVKKQVQDTQLTGQLEITDTDCNLQEVGT